MRPRGAAAALLGVFVLLVPVVAASSYSERSVGTPEQIAWVRQAAHRFLAAELAADGAEACTVLNAPLRATIHGRTCAQRWDTRLVKTTKEHGVRSRLRAQLRAIASARIVVRGDVASIELPTALLHGSSRFLWTENCWMLED